MATIHTLPGLKNETEILLECRNMALLEGRVIKTLTGSQIPQFVDLRFDSIRIYFPLAAMGIRDNHPPVFIELKEADFPAIIHDEQLGEFLKVTHFVISGAAGHYFLSAKVSGEGGGNAETTSQSTSKTGKEKELTENTNNKKLFKLIDSHYHHFGKPAKSVNALQNPMESLIAAGLSVNAPQKMPSGRFTPLEYAIRANCPDFVRVLLKNGAKLTPICFSLLAQALHVPAQKFPSGLESAWYEARNLIFRLLLAQEIPSDCRKVDTGFLITTLVSQKNVALTKKVFEIDKKCIQHLEYSVQRLLPSLTSSKWTCSTQEIEMLELLLSKGAPLPSEEHIRKYMLSCISRLQGYQSDPEQTKSAYTLFTLFLKHGHNPNVETYLGSYLYQAIDYSIIKLVEILISHGADVNDTFDSKKKAICPLYFAVSLGNEAIIKLLFNAGIKKTTLAGVFEYIINYRKYQLIPLFLELGIEPLKQKFELLTPFCQLTHTSYSTSARDLDLEAVSTFIKLGYDLNLGNPLADAIKWRSWEMADLLIQNGSSVYAVEPKQRIKLPRYVELYLKDDAQYGEAVAALAQEIVLLASPRLTIVDMDYQRLSALIYKVLFFSKEAQTMFFGGGPKDYKLYEYSAVGTMSESKRQSFIKAMSHALQEVLLAHADTIEDTLVLAMKKWSRAEIQRKGEKASRRIEARAVEKKEKEAEESRKMQQAILDEQKKQTELLESEAIRRQEDKERFEAQWWEEQARAEEQRRKEKEESDWQRHQDQLSTENAIWRAKMDLQSAINWNNGGKGW